MTFRYKDTLYKGLFNELYTIDAYIFHVLYIFNNNTILHPNTFWIISILGDQYLWYFHWHRFGIGLRYAHIPGSISHNKAYSSIHIIDRPPPPPHSVETAPTTAFTRLTFRLSLFSCPLEPHGFAVCWRGLSHSVWRVVFLCWAPAVYLSSRVDLWSGNLRRVGVILQRGILILLLACFPCWALLVNTEPILLAVRQSPEVARWAICPGFHLRKPV